MSEAISAFGYNTIVQPIISSANLITGLTLAGAAGTSGQVLTSAGSGLPTWTTPAGALVFISTQTVTTPVASVNFTTGIDSTFDNYQIIFSNFVVASGGRLGLRLRQGTTFKSANYANMCFTVQAGGVFTSPFEITDTFIMANGGGTPDVNSFWSGYFTLTDANNATRRIPAVNGYLGCIGNGGASSTIQSFSGAQDVAGVITGLQLLSRSGSNLNSGTVTLYGIKKS
jgi:hypothetical protein